METSKYTISHQISDLDILIVNTVTGAVDIADHNVYHFLGRRGEVDSSTIDSSILECLKTRGYLVENNEAEVVSMRKLGAILQNRPKRLSFVICPTYTCNLRCTYCFEGSLTASNSLSMSEAEIPYVLSAIDELCQIYSERRASIELFGGEPLLPNTKNFFDSLMNEAGLRNIPVSIVTNGTHVPLFAARLKKYKPVIRSVQVTLDGPPLVHNRRRKLANGKGTFDRVCSAVDLLLSIGLQVMVRVNVDSQNISSVPELLQIFKNKGWSDNDKFMSSMSPVLDHAMSGIYKYLTPEDVLAKKILKLMKTNPEIEGVFGLNMFRTLAHIRSVVTGGKTVPPMLYYCEANYLENIIFGPDGLIYACSECIGKPELAIGKFMPSLELDDEKLAMWNNRSVFRIKKCSDCDIAFLCGGGCAYSAIAVNGDIDEPVCGRSRETVFAYLDYLGQTLINKT